MPSLLKVSNAHAISHPHAIKVSMIHHTKPSFSIAPWTKFDAHMSILVAFVDEHGSAWAL